MIIYDYITKESRKISKLATNSLSAIQNINNWRLMISKTNALLNLIKQDDDDYSFIGKIYLYVKNRNEAQYQYLTRKCEKVALKTWKTQRLSLNIILISRYKY